MGALTFVEAFFLLGICLIVNLVAFYGLFFEVFKKCRRFLWITFFASMVALVFFWFSFFFPEMLLLEKIDATVLDFGFVCLFSFAASAIFIWVWLKGKKECDQVCYLVGKIMVILLSVIILFFTFKSLDIRFKHDMQEEETFVEEPCVVSCLNSTIIMRGGSLCGTLGMTRQCALTFAKEHKLKYYHRGNKLIVIIYPGDEFMKVGDVWMPVVKPTFK